MKLLFCLLVLAAASGVEAQDTIALQSYALTDIGTTTATAGWSFQPLTNVSVTALGCFEDCIIGHQGGIWVGLWAADGTLLATNAVTTNSTLISQFRYEPINPVLLVTNETYYLGAFPPSGVMVINAYSPDDGPGYVNMAPEIQLNMAADSTNSSFSFPDEMSNPPGSAILAPNFEFQDGIAPPVLNIAPASNDVLISWSATYTGLVLRENSDLTTTNWITTTNPVVTTGGQNEVLISSPIGNNFYRLESQ